MSTRQRHPAELRERATRMAVDLRKDPETYRGAVKRVAEQLGINTETLRDWVKKAEIDEGTRPGVTSAESARIQELERENRELRRANQILKSSAAFFAAEFDRPSK
ncbi:transposase [Kocuria carniphila]|uniref:Transposase n=1 Tax=Kocuria carniphila TaxID=262208 RepID=A0ABV3V992_9MICC